MQVSVLKRWQWAGLYIIIIFLTAPLMPEIVKIVAGWLGLGIKQFLTYIKVVILSVLASVLPLYLYQSGRHKDKTCWGVLVLIGVAASFLVANLGSPVEATHLLEYGGLSIVLFYTLAKNRDKPLPQKLYYQAALVTSLVGILDELYQGYLPNRYYDFNDIITNTVSGALGLFFLWGVVKPHKEPDLPSHSTN